MNFIVKCKDNQAMFTLNCKGKLVVIENPLVMGILNITPDSFYSESRMMEKDEVLSKAEKMLNDGADILDIGGQSTRPGSEKINVEEELRRVIDKIAAIHERFPEAIISVDTVYNDVVKEAVAAGASIVNDISGGNMDEKMLATVGSLHVAYICMHMRGTPQTMQKNPVYKNVTEELLDFFIEKKQACKTAGIHDVIIDPGLGFGKTSHHNFELLKNLSVFKMTGNPILVGISRKSTIYKTLGVTAKEALNGTTSLNTIALLNGANILRVHDVKEAKEVVKLFSVYTKALVRSDEQ
jgi:dihydropteroate synthase